MINKVAIPADGNSKTYASDLEVLGDGSIAVRGGVVKAETYLYRNGSWSELISPPTSTIAGSYNSSRIGAYGNYLYMRNPNTYIAGIKRFKIENGRVTKEEIFTNGFTSSNNVHNPIYGQNGKPYAFDIIDVSGAIQHVVKELNSSTLGVVKTVNLINYQPSHGIHNVDSSGNIYYFSKVSSDGRYKAGITKVNSNGAFIKSLALSGTIYDIEVYGSTILVANDNNVYVSDSNLSTSKALLPSNFFSSAIRSKYVTFNVPNGPTTSSSATVKCVLNSPSANNGGFGIHNSYVENTSSTAVSGWTKTIDFGSATPSIGWNWGVDARTNGNKVILSKAGSLAPGARITFGLGGNYSGPKPSTLKCL